MKYLIAVLLMFSEYTLGYVEHHVNIVLERSAKLKQGSITPRDLNISSCDFREAGSLLKGIYLSGVTAAGVNFGLFQNKQAHQFSKGPTDLTGADFSASYLGSANFDGCILKNANFDSANVIKTNFANADLTGASFKNAQNVDLAVFRGAIMPNGQKWAQEAWKNNRVAMFKLKSK